MLNSISHSAIFVLDQDEALDFYVGKLGMEVGADVDLGVMRWLTVHVPGRPEHQVLLEVPGPPAMGDETAAQVRDLVTRGATGMAFILTTDDCRAAHEALSAKGVEFTQAPTEMPYGIDAGLRDPFGNNLRLTQPAKGPVEFTDEDRSALKASVAERV